jgi:hypothetical protein
MKKIIINLLVFFPLCFSSYQLIDLTESEPDVYPSISFMKYDIETGVKSVINPNIAGIPAYSSIFSKFYYVKDVNRTFFLGDSTGYFEGENSKPVKFNHISRKSLFSNTQKWILFAEGDWSGKNVFLLNTSTLEIFKVNIPHFEDLEEYLSFSTDDEEIVFVGSDPTLYSTTLYIMETATRTTSKITDFSFNYDIFPSINYPVFSSDKQKIFFVLTKTITDNQAYSKPGLYSINRDGSSLTLIDEGETYADDIYIKEEDMWLSEAGSWITDVTIAASGNKVFYCNKGNIYSVNQDGSGIVNTGISKDYSGYFKVSSSGNKIILSYKGTISNIGFYNKQNYVIID